MAEPIASAAVSAKNLDLIARPPGRVVKQEPEHTEKSGRSLFALAHDTL
jgi:hypothetical protein